MNSILLWRKRIDLTEEFYKTAIYACLSLAQISKLVFIIFWNCRCRLNLAVLLELTTVNVKIFLPTPVFVLLILHAAVAFQLETSHLICSAN